MTALSAAGKTRQLAGAALSASGRMEPRFRVLTSWPGGRSPASRWEGRTELAGLLWGPRGTPGEALPAGCPGLEPIICARLTTHIDASSAFALLFLRSHGIHTERACLSNRESGSVLLLAVFIE